MNKKNKIRRQNTVNFSTSLILRTVKVPRRLPQDFWIEVAKCFPEWKLVRERKMSAGEVRERCIHSHGVVLPSDRSCRERADERAERRLEETASDLAEDQLVSLEWRAVGGSDEVGGHVQKGNQNMR
jgi:DNA sulfur modification protein DndB